MYDPLRAQSGIPLGRLCRQGDALLLPRWLFIKDISISAFGIFGLGTGKDVESLLLVRCAKQCRIARALVLQERICGRGHSKRCETFFGGCALV